MEGRRRAVERRRTNDEPLTKLCRYLDTPLISLALYSPELTSSFCYLSLPCSRLLYFLSFSLTSQQCETKEDLRNCFASPNLSYREHSVHFSSSPTVVRKKFAMVGCAAPSSSTSVCRSATTLAGMSPNRGSGPSRRT